MDSRLQLEFDMRPVGLSISADFDVGTMMGGWSIRAGDVIVSHHFGASVYLEVMGICADGEIIAVIMELDDQILDPEIIHVFEARVPVRLSVHYVFSIAQRAFKTPSN